MGNQITLALVTLLLAKEVDDRFRCLGRVRVGMDSAGGDDGVVINVEGT